MKLVKRNRKLHNLDSPLLVGDIKECDVVKESMNPVILKLMKKFYHFDEERPRENFIKLVQEYHDFYKSWMNCTNAHYFSNDL